MSAELVGIELQLKGYDGVMADMRALDKMLNSFRGSRNKITLQSDLSKAKAEVIALQGELNRLRDVRDRLSAKGIKSEGLANKIKEVTSRLRDAQQATRELQYALKNLSSMSFSQAFNKISSAVAHLGSAMQSAGNALTRLTSPFADFTKGMVMGAGYKALGKFTEGLENGFNRYDIMKKYPKLMAEFETKSYSAEQSINDLDKAVRGLPTGLDEMVGLSQRFTMTLGDMRKGTELAIATNNAFLASMSTDTQRYQGMMQLQDVVGGKKMTSKEWQSLANAMMPAIRMMGTDLGKSGKELREWVAAVQQGKVSNEEFLDALVKTGTGTGKAAKAAQQSKDTWQAFFANVGNAASRMTAGVITSMDEVVKTLGLVDKDGMAIESVNRLLSDRLVPAIDDMTASVKGWIAAHPDEIIDFFKSFKSINIRSIINGFGEAIIGVARLTQNLAGLFSGRDLSWIGKFMIYGNQLGKVLTFLGGMLKGSRHPIAGAGAGILSMLKGIKGIKEQGFMKWLAGQLVGDDPKATEEAVKTATRTAPKMGKFMTGLSKVFTGWAEIATMVGGTALVGFGTFKAFKSMFKDLKEITEISKTIDWDTATADLFAMGVFLTGFIKVGSKVGTALGTKGLIGGGIFAGMTALFAGTFWADMAMIKRGFKAILDTTGIIQDTIDNLNGLTKVTDVGTMKANIKHAITIFNQIAELLQIERNNPVTGEAKGGLKQLDKKSASTVKNIASAISDIKSAVDDLNGLNSVTLNTDNMLNVFGKLQHGLNMLGTVLTNMPSVFKDNTASGWAASMSGTVTNFSSALQGLVGENGIIAQIPKLINGIEGLDSTGALLDLPGKMKKIGTALTEIYTSLQGIGAGEYFASNIDNFRAGIKSLKFAIMHVQEISGMTIGDGVVTKIQNLISNIQSAFDQTQIVSLSATITTFAASIKMALAILDSLNQEIEIDVSVKLSDAFDQSVKDTVDKIQEGKDKIKAMKKGISFSIPVHVTFSVTTNLGSALASIASDKAAIAASGADGGGGGHSNKEGGGNRFVGATGGRFSRNGVLYRSGGGSVFKPRGVDKVPAMLQEGEYVQKKQAVDLFGLDFMRKVNNLDVRGAMQALLTRAGSATSIGRQSIFNQTVNNNQRVIQNINTNNPSFAGMQMGRFVGAL